MTRPMTALWAVFLGAEAALEAKYREANAEQGIEAKAEEAAILSKRINTPYQRATKADSAMDGIHISLRERGKLDMQLIADLTGKDIKSVHWGFDHRRQASGVL